MTRERRRAYFDEANLYAVLKIINSHCREHIKMRLIVGNCEELDSPSIWYVHFDATDREWCSIVQDFDAVGNITVIDRPQAPQPVIYFRKNREDD
jgi:hypothetical protein